MFSMRSVITERHAVTLHRGSVGVTESPEGATRAASVQQRPRPSFDFRDLR